MVVRILFFACLCLAARVQGAAFGEACNQDSDCTDAHTKCATNCVCADDSTRQNDACKVKQGQACQATTDCVEYAECSTNCNCKDGSKGSGDVCVTVYDATCTTAAAATDCAGLSNFACTDGKCKCAAGYKAGTDSPKACMAIIGEPCTTENVATACPLANTVCTNSKCACKTGYEGAACTKILGTKICGGNTDCTDVLDRTKCSATKCECDDTSVAQNDVCKVRIEETCAAATDCPNDAECTASKCVCKSGYIKDNYICKVENSSTTARASVLVIFAAVFATFFR